MIVSKKVNAKINLSLNILSKESSGFHSLDMVLASVSLADAISISPRNDKNIRVDFSESSRIQGARFIPQKANSAYLAAKEFQDAFDTLGFDISITKNIPLGGGLGGSSADAAGVLFMLAEIFDKDFRALEVAKLAEKVGSDVAYMMNGGFARANNRGESLKFFADFPELFLVLVSGKTGVSTKESYQKFDEIFTDFSFAPSDNDALISCLRSRDITGAEMHFGNALLAPSLLLNPEIESSLQALKATGATSVNMSGSGSCCFGIFPTKKAADNAAEKLKNICYFAESVQTVANGIK